jgi:transcriptional regulator with XRE-family HTH domain
MDINPLEIKRLREQKGMSLNELARKAGMSTNTVFRIEGGKASREKTIKKIADALAVDVHTLNKGSVQEGGGSADKDEVVAQREAYNKGWEGGTEGGKITELFTKVAELLESSSVYRQALAANINAFYQALRTEDKNRDLEAKVQTLESRLAAVEEKLKGV